MPPAPRSTRRAAQSEPEDDRPPSRLMRVPVETYETIARWAKLHRRHMNQELAVIVEEWDRAERQKQAKEAKRAV